MIVTTVVVVVGAGAVVVDVNGAMVVIVVVGAVVFAWTVGDTEGDDDVTGTALTADGARVVVIMLDDGICILLLLEDGMDDGIVVAVGASHLGRSPREALPLALFLPQRWEAYRKAKGVAFRRMVPLSELYW
jgi:hypothetical protein